LVQAHPAPSQAWVDVVKKEGGRLELVECHAGIAR
jgi:hypothetical protein